MVQAETQLGFVVPSFGHNPLTLIARTLVQVFNDATLERVGEHAGCCLPSYSGIGDSLVIALSTALPSLHGILVRVDLSQEIKQRACAYKRLSA